ncbi:hypothetical protein [Streptomyces sp.]|uniref:hypothetical protein n=1 Tax=Streptomyces sp. TaxID=1931 RepID=UPI002F3E854B
MSDESAGTKIQDRYAQEFAADLEKNTKEQEGIRSQIAELQARLGQLEQEQTWLVRAQGTLAAGRVAPPPADSPGDSAEAAPAQAAGTQAVPQPRRVKKAAGKTGGNRTKAKAKPAAATTATRSASTAVPKEQKADTAGAKKSDGPPLRDLVLALLVQHHEPRQVSEVAGELAQAHPDRPASIQVVRNTLEALVAKGELERERQKRSVFYTAPGPGTADTAPEVPAEPEEPEEKVAAEV